MSWKKIVFISPLVIGSIVLCGTLLSASLIAVEKQGGGEVTVDAVEREPLERTLEAEQTVGNPFQKVIEPEGPVQNIDPQVQKFLPALNRVLTIEMHYLRKICDPQPNQLEQIRSAGHSQLIVLAKELSQQENKGFKIQATDSRERMRDAILKSAKEVLPSDKFDLYLTEVQQRQMFLVEGACELKTFYLDYTLSFSGDQYNQAFRLLIEGANPSWDSNWQAIMYSREFCPLPDSSVLAPVLNDLQKIIWQGKGRTNSTLSLGWPIDIGIGMFGEGMKFEELDDYHNEDANE